MALLKHFRIPTNSATNTLSTTVIKRLQNTMQHFFQITLLKPNMILKDLITPPNFQHLGFLENQREITSSEHLHYDLALKNLSIYLIGAQGKNSLIKAISINPISKHVKRKKNDTNLYHKGVFSYFHESWIT